DRVVVLELVEPSDHRRARAALDRRHARGAGRRGRGLPSGHAGRGVIAARIVWRAASRDAAGARRAREARGQHARNPTTLRPGTLLVRAHLWSSWRGAVNR